MTELFTRYQYLKARGMKVSRVSQHVNDIKVEFDDDFGIGELLLTPDDARALCAMLADTLEIRDPVLDLPPAPAPALSKDEVVLGGHRVLYTRASQGVGLSQVGSDPSKSASFNKCRQADKISCDSWSLYDEHGSYQGSVADINEAARFVATGTIPTVKS